MRNAHHSTLDNIYNTLTKKPGLNRKQLAHLIGIKSKHLDFRLVTLETNGYLLSEDKDGNLYPFARVTRSRAHPTHKRTCKKRVALTHTNKRAKIKQKGGGIQR